MVIITPCSTDGSSFHSVGFFIGTVLYFLLCGTRVMQLLNLGLVDFSFSKSDENNGGVGRL